MSGLFICFRLPISFFGKVHEEQTNRIIDDTISDVVLFLSEKFYKNKTDLIRMKSNQTENNNNV